ncbi:MAG: ATP-binding protein [Myxococcota bacterium]
MGRVHEWSELLSAWQHSSREGMRCVLIQGVAGIGKTRLAEEMAQYVQQQGHRVGGAICSQSDLSGAFSVLSMLLKVLPVASSLPSVLAEVARLVPEVYETNPTLPEVRSLNEPGQRQHFFQALARYLFEQEPLLLWIDDIQWCDDATLEFMQYLFRTFSLRRVLWLATLRMDDAPSRGQLPQDLLPSLRRQKVLYELTLGPLTQKESTTLLLAEAREALSPHLLEALYAEAEGTPLYLLELLRARHFQAQTAVMAGNYPHTLTEAVAVRCSVLTHTGRLCLDALAAVEGPASVELLAQVCERSELEILQELDDLLRRRLIEERPDASVQFAHGLIGSIVYRLMSLPKRRVLHRRIAEALCSAPEALRELALQIASQLEKAQLQEKAGPYLMAAGKRATQFAEHPAARLHF